MRIGYWKEKVYRTKSKQQILEDVYKRQAVEDIKRVQEVIARENKQLVYTHYNLIVTVKPDTDIQKLSLIHI